MKSGPILVFDCFGVFCGDPMVEFFRRHYGPNSAPLKDSFCDGADLGNVSFDDVILRMCETWNKKTDCTVTFADKIADASICNLLEEKDEAVETDGNTVKLQFRPFEIKTLKIRK